MKRFIMKQELRAMELKNKALIKARQAVELLKNKDGDGLTVGQMIWIIIGIVLGTILLVGLILFIKTKFFPTLDSKTDEFLNMK